MFHHSDHFERIDLSALTLHKKKLLAKNEQKRWAVIKNRLQNNATQRISWREMSAWLVLDIEKLYLAGSRRTSLFLERWQTNNQLPKVVIIESLFCFFSVCVLCTCLIENSYQAMRAAP